MAEPRRVLPFQELKEEIERAEREASRIGAHLPRGGGGDNYGGMDAWQTSVESRLSELRQDIRDLTAKVDRNFIITWGGLIALGIGTGSLIGRAFGWF